ncbi:MAG: glycosyltransferase [Thermoplasmata archaeon]|nr:glycosyltransferase [Thermoplasmata archaeon]
MIRCLKDDYSITVFAAKEASVEGVETVSAVGAKTPRRGLGRIVRAGLVMFGLALAHLHLYRLAYSLWSYLRVPLTGPMDSPEVKARLLERDFDLVISHDLVLLPLAFIVRKGAKVLFDARELYQYQREDDLMWRMLRQPIYRYLCVRYLSRCDEITTVSESIAEEYHRAYGKKPEVVLSLPERHELVPSPVQEEKIRMIHHGAAAVPRRIEQMIELMDYVDGRFSLDLMLIPETRAYWNRLVAMVDGKSKVRIIPPVPMQEIVQFVNRYDVGLFLCKPTTRNLELMLPNKLFEFIQARLAVAIGPSVEMRKIVEKYDCGIVAPDFEPQSLAKALNALNPKKLRYYKQQAHKAAMELNAEASAQEVREIVSNLIGG